MKEVEVRVIRSETHPWNPNVVEYDVIEMQDGEPIHHISGVLLPSPSIQDSMTLAQVKALCVADATANNYLT